MNKKTVAEYWIKTSDNDFKTMMHLFQNKHYNWALFLGHLIIEKLLKAYYVKKINQSVPITHDLLRIAEKANLKLTEQQKDFLDIVTTFNIRVRYDDYKMEFHKKCNKKFTEEQVKKIKEFRKWIKDKL